MLLEVRFSWVFFGRRADLRLPGRLLAVKLSLLTGHADAHHYNDKQ